MAVSQCRFSFNESNRRLIKCWNFYRSCCTGSDNECSYTFPLSTGFSTISSPSVLSGTFPTVASQACTLPQAEVVSPAATSALALAPATCTITVLQPASSLMSRSAQLPTSILSPAWSANQSGGQVIVNGTGVNLNINGASTHKCKILPNLLCSS